MKYDPQERLTAGMPMIARSSPLETELRKNKKMKSVVMAEEVTGAKATAKVYGNHGLRPEAAPR